MIHVQTEDKGRGNPFIESVVYVAGRVVATKRSTYAQLLEEGKGDPEISALMDHQHRTIVAAIRAGRFDAKLQELKGPPRPQHATGIIAVPAPSGHEGDDSLDVHAQTMLQTKAASGPAPLGGSAPGGEVLDSSAIGSAADFADLAQVTILDDGDEGPTLDQVILDYLSTEAEHEQLVLAMDAQEEIQSGKVNNLTLRAYSSKSGLPLAGVQVSVKMLSTVADPRTLMIAETDDVGSIEMHLDVPAFARGSAALIISGTSNLGRAEIKQLL
ncbi:MAG: hypothetical protein ABI639_00820 [Thermoanaerobaculia bacterium]